MQGSLLISSAYFTKKKDKERSFSVCLINSNFLIISPECPFDRVLQVDYASYTNSVSFFCHFGANSGAGPLLDADIHRA